MELLNLDSLIGETRPVILNGKQYEVREQTIQQMLEHIRSQKLLDENDAEAMFESMLKTAMAILPDAPEKEVRAINVKQLQALIDYASSQPEDLEIEDDVEDKSDEGK